jgi:putative ABC transport system ATP-binding protein
MRGAEPTLRLQGVSVELGLRSVLRGIDLLVQAGVPVALTGTSGSGKTVLCLVLAGALAPSTGRVELDGRPLRAGRSSVGLVPQHHGLLGSLTADENVSLPLQSRKLPRGKIEELSSNALASVGLSDHATRLVDDLSGGEAQRVAVARALAGDPMVVVADEPTAELDPENRARVLGLLLKHAEAQRIVVVASDDPEVIGAFSRVMQLDRGQIVS